MNFIHKTLMAIGLWLLAMAAQGQVSGSFTPADFGGTPITVPIQGAAYVPFPDAEFSFDCKIWLEELAWPQPIFSKGSYDGCCFIALSATEEGELAFRYTVSTDAEGHSEGHRNVVLSEKGLVKPNQWTQIAMAHTPSKTRFWVNERPVGSHFSEGSKPGTILFGSEPWLLGGILKSPKEPPTPVDGRLDDMRFWCGNMTELYRSRPGGRPVPKSYEDLLLADYDMEGLDPKADLRGLFVENRSDATDGFLNGKFMKPEGPVDVDKLLKDPAIVRILKEKKQKPTETEPIPAWMAMSIIGVFVVYIFLWVAKTTPGATYFSNSKSVPAGLAEAALVEKHVDLPIEFGQLWPGERLEFVVHTGSPLPWWRLAMVAGQLAIGLFLLRGMWAQAIEGLLSDDESEQMTGILKIVFMLGVMLAFLWYNNRQQWAELLHLFRGKRTVVGTSERLILGNPGGANRTIFWEQIRSVERDTVSVALKFELRSGPMHIDSFAPEIFWLTDLDDTEAVFQCSKTLVASKPVTNSGDDSLNFHPGMTAGGPEAWFGPCELHQTLLFSAADFFGENQLLMLRSRIKGAVVEPYDIPVPGWAVVLYLGNGVRFPLFFTEDLGEAKKAAACISKGKS